MNLEHVDWLAVCAVAISVSLIKSNPMMYIQIDLETQPSRQSGTSRTPRTSSKSSSSSLNLQFDSSGEDFNAALQLSFESPGKNIRLSPDSDKDAVPKSFEPPKRSTSKKKERMHAPSSSAITQPSLRTPSQQKAPSGWSQPGQSPYQYPIYPYGGQMPPPGQMPTGYFPPMMPGMPMQPYQSGPMYAYPPQMMHMMMPPPSTPAGASATPRKTPGTAASAPPRKTPGTTPAKRKERRNDANLTVETEDLSFDAATPASPPSSKKKREGFGIGTWPSPPDYPGEDVVSTPQFLFHVESCLCSSSN